MSGQDTAERFASDTATHEMTVLHDDGLYRHLRFTRVVTDEKTGKRSKSSLYWFDLVTWPGCLAINGDCGACTFSRVTDMFEFFRGSRINPGYWAEKVRGETTVKSYDEDLFREHVWDAVKDAEKDYPGLAEAVQEEIFGTFTGYNTAYEPDARRAVEEFEFGSTVTAECSCGERRERLSQTDAYRWHTTHLASAPIGSGTHRITDKRVEGFRFHGAWEWNLHDFDWQFLWCCHAIQWGIRQYESRRVAA